MSTVPPSVSAMPLVTSGTATTPPVPVFVAIPAPSRLNHVSIVNVDDAEPGRGAERHSTRSCRRNRSPRRRPDSGSP